MTSRIKMQSVVVLMGFIFFGVMSVSAQKKEIAPAANYDGQKAKTAQCMEVQYEIKMKHPANKDTTRYKVHLSFFSTGKDSFQFIAEVDSDRIFAYDMKDYYWATNKYVSIEHANWEKIRFDILYKPGAWIRWNDNLYIMPLIKGKDFLKGKSMRRKGEPVYYEVENAATDKLIPTKYQLFYSRNTGALEKYIVSDTAQYIEYDIKSSRNIAKDSAAFAESIHKYIKAISADKHIFWGYWRPLDSGGYAPDWKLPLALRNDSLQLYADRHKLILLDFSYISCGPCQKAIPEMIRLYSRYKDKGLEIIGIDPIDKDTAIASFIEKGRGLVPLDAGKPFSEMEPAERAGYIKQRKINYPVVSSYSKNDPIPGNYHISGYPAFYILNKDKKIIYSQDGYRKDMDEKLEDFIKKALEK